MTPVVAVAPVLLFAAPASAASTFDPKNDTTSFFSGGVGSIIQSFATVLAIVAVVVGGILVIKALLGGRIGKAFTSLIGTMIIGGFLFNLAFVGQGLDIGKRVMNSVFQTGNSQTSKGGQ
ncbi:MAG: hypothetical protein JO086_06940 [Acidimicrobiia bacterium]|nr:hypothetical protein [Acidimicrobiia bacterium]